MEHNRLVTFDGTVNFRDIGGYENNEGKHVKWNKIYRSDSLSSLTKRDEEKLEEMKVTVDCDLRTSNELSVNDSHKLYRFLHHIPKVNSYLGEIYQNVILSPASQKAFARVFASLLTLPEDEALVYHCSAGKDRTGMTTALILKGLGVDEHTIARDYLLTNELYTFGLKKQLPSDSEMIKMVNRMNITEGEGTAIEGITQTIDIGYGGFENYFTKELGFSRQDLKDFRKMYLE